MAGGGASGGEEVEPTAGPTRGHRCALPLWGTSPGGGVRGLGVARVSERADPRPPLQMGSIGPARPSREGPALEPRSLSIKRQWRGMGNVWEAEDQLLQVVARLKTKAFLARSSEPYCF